MRIPYIKLLLSLVALLVSLYLAAPSYPFAGGAPSWLPARKMSLGLDLRGGSYLLLELNVTAYMSEQLEGIRDELRTRIAQETKEGQRIYYVGGVKADADKVTLKLKDPAQQDAVMKILHKISSDLDVQAQEGVVTAVFTEKAKTDMRKRVMEQTLEIVRRRVDETGTREPDIQRQGDTRILLQVPGLDNPEHLKELLGKTAKLTFHEVRRDGGGPTSPLPPGFDRVNYERREGSVDVRKEVMISGEHLADASAGYNQYGEPVVNIRFDSVGARKFADATKQYLGHPFAILLDHKALTAPVIRAVILDGRAEISGNFTAQEATDLSALLRAGALPAPLTILEERSVGPSLGQDSVEAGKISVIAALGVVSLFMVAVYELVGLFACVSLLLNLVMIVAAMSVIGATLTLPGIAGMVLTIGMAVDANVLINERTKEELRAGARISKAITEGYDRAFVTIFDSNLTGLLSAGLLYAFGSGAVKGFAVTLTIGILCSMFSAITVTRALTLTWIATLKPKYLFRFHKRMLTASAKPAKPAA